MGLYPAEGSTLDLMEIRRIADEDLVEKLQLDGVAAVKVRGGDEEEIRIEVDEGRLTGPGHGHRHGRRAGSSSENVNAAAGSIDEGETEYLVRALGEYRDPSTSCVQDHRRPTRRRQRPASTTWPPPGFGGSLPTRT